MKKKMLATLAALMVLACGTTVLAAPSATAEDLAKGVTATTADGKAVTVTAVESESIVSDAKAEAVKVEAKAEVLALVDVDVTVPAGETLTLTFKVASVKAGANIIVLHYDETAKAWEKITPDKVAAGEVTATFKSLSPVAIVELPATETTSPKTGAPVVLPVAALICAAGAAGCARKVKFN